MREGQEHSGITWHRQKPHISSFQARKKCSQPTTAFFFVYILYRPKPSKSMTNHGKLKAMLAVKLLLHSAVLSRVLMPMWVGRTCKKAYHAVLTAFTLVKAQAVENWCGATLYGCFTTNHSCLNAKPEQVVLVETAHMQLDFSAMRVQQVLAIAF